MVLSSHYCLYDYCKNEQEHEQEQSAKIKHMQYFGFNEQYRAETNNYYSILIIFPFYHRISLQLFWLTRVSADME